VGKLKNDQNGFSYVEVLLILIVVLLVGFIGYYVYHSQKNTNTTYNQTTLNSQSSLSNSAKHYFVIKEWDVRAPYSGSLNLQYVIDTSDSNTAEFTSTQLKSTSVTECRATDAGALISRYEANDQVVGEIASAASSGTAADVYNALVSQGSKQIAHVGNYYYFLTGPQSACDANASSNINANKLQTETTADVISLMGGLQAIPK